MLGRVLLKAQAQVIYGHVEKVRGHNTGIVREKLKLYRQLPDPQAIERSAHLVTQQIDMVAGIQDLVADVQPRLRDAQSLGRISLYLADGSSLAARLMQALRSQRAILQDMTKDAHHTLSSYQVYVREELAVYSSYDSLIQAFGASIGHTPTSTIQFLVAETTAHLKSTVYVVAFLGLLGTYDHAVFQRCFRDLETGAQTATVIIAVSVFFRFLEKRLRRLARHVRQ